MFNPLNLLSKIIKSSNQRELDRVQKITTKVNNLENNIIELSDDDFPKKTKMGIFPLCISFDSIISIFFLLYQDNS